MLFPSRRFLLFREDEMLQDPSIVFLLPSYVEAQAQVLTPPPQVDSKGYEPKVIDDETSKNV
jgi:hypothetical protein